jgi:diketogulonate reductase-like aldo/keto reductase
MMIKRLTDTTTLHNGVKMPRIGLGVWKVRNNSEVVNAVKYALEAGYRSIDTASFYKNEEGVGQGLRESGVPRDEIFVTSKVWNSDHGYEETLKAFEESLTKLGLEYLDLYLIHWPVVGKYKETWKALEKLYKDGKVRAIGVSNFHGHHLEDLIKDAEIKPMIDQVEFHPRLAQKELRSFCTENGIQMEAWSPLMQGKILDNADLIEIGQKYDKTAAQVILRWDLQSGFIAIPKSVNKERIIQNTLVFDFELTQEDMDKIDALNQDKRVGADPDHFDF